MILFVENTNLATHGFGADVNLLCGNSQQVSKVVVFLQIFLTLCGDEIWFWIKFFDWVNALDQVSLGLLMSFAMFSLRTISDVWGLCALGPMHWLHPFTCNRLRDYPRHKNSLWLVVICWKSAIVFHLIGALPPQLAAECVVGGRELIVRRWFAPKKLPSQRSKTSQCLKFLP